jgi:hypothetical protein
MKMLSDLRLETPETVHNASLPTTWFKHCACRTVCFSWPWLTWKYYLISGWKPQKQCITPLYQPHDLNTVLVKWSVFPDLDLHEDATWSQAINPRNSAQRLSTYTSAWFNILIYLQHLRLGGQNNKPYMRTGVKVPRFEALFTLKERDWFREQVKMLFY